MIYGDLSNQSGNCKMHTIYDFLTVAFFLGLIVSFFLFTDRHPKTLGSLLVSAIAFAVGNQLGNAGSNVLALAMIGAGAGYGCLVIRG
jgi:hypothetical protein